MYWSLDRLNKPKKVIKIDCSFFKNSHFPKTNSFMSSFKDSLDHFPRFQEHSAHKCRVLINFWKQLARRSLQYLYQNLTHSKPFNFKEWNFILNWLSDRLKLPEGIPLVSTFLHFQMHFLHSNRLHVLYQGLSRQFLIIISVLKTVFLLFFMASKFSVAKFIKNTFSVDFFHPHY